MSIIFIVDNHNPLVLHARVRYDHGAVTQTGLGEIDMDPIQHWCEANKCGRRISFDMFQFKNNKELTMFLLKWQQ